MIKKILKYSLITILILFFVFVGVLGLFTSVICEDNTQDVFLCD